MIAAKSAAISILNNAEHGGFGRRLSGIGALSQGRVRRPSLKISAKQSSRFAGYTAGDVR